MKHTIQNILNRPLYVISGAAVFALIFGVVAFGQVGKSPTYAYATVETGDVSGDITVSGTVAPADTINLSFPKSGRVNSVSVHTGQKVAAGQILAALDSQDVLGSLNQAKGAYEAAVANYNKVINGASSSDIDVAKAAVVTAQNNLAGVKSQADTAVDNAYRTLLNSGLAAVPTGGDAGLSGTPIISGIYTGTEGQYIITPYNGGTGQYFSASGIENGEGKIGSAAPQPLGTHGLYIQFPNNFSVNSSNTWVVNIPNTQGSTYVANYNAYQSALTSRDQMVNNAQAQLDQAQTALAAKQTAARPEDIASAQAQVDSTLGAYQAAQGAYANSLITSPIDGTITLVNLKAGQNATANQTAIGVISEGKFDIDVYVSADDANAMSLGATSTVLFDAHPGAVYSAKIIDVDSGSTVVGSQATYKVTFELTNPDSGIQTGMAAHITVNGPHKSGVLEIPREALITENGEHTVMLKKGNAAVSQPIQTGVIGSDTVEVVSGLSAGDSVALLGDSTTN